MPGVAQRVGRVIAPLFHDRGARRWMSGQQHAPAALYPRGKTRYPFYRRLFGPQGRSEQVRKISSPTVIRPRTVQSVGLYRLSYPDHSYKLVASKFYDTDPSRGTKCDTVCFPMFPDFRKNASFFERSPGFASFPC